MKRAPTLIGKPFNVQHNVHVQVGKYGFKGLPIKWQKILLASGVPEEVVNNNPATVEKLMHNIRMPDSLQSNNNNPPPPSSSSCSSTSSSLSQQPQEEELPIGYAPPSRARTSKLLHLSLFKSSTDIPPLPDSLSSSKDSLTNQHPHQHNTINSSSESHLSLNSSFIGKLTHTQDFTFV